MIILTRPAIAAIENVLRREGKTDGGVRISVTNGGCSGPNYEMMVESAPGPDDTIIEIRGVRLFVAAEKMPMFVGVTVDYSPRGGPGFFFESSEAVLGDAPAASGCGCGKSCSSAPIQ